MTLWISLAILQFHCVTVKVLLKGGLMQGPIHPKSTPRLLFDGSPYLYLTSSLTGLTAEERARRLPLYEEIASMRPGGFEVFLPHLNTDPVMHADKEPVDVNAADDFYIKHCSGAIADLTFPSDGKGGELVLLRIAKKPIIGFVPRLMIAEETRGVPGVARLSRYPWGVIQRTHHEIHGYETVSPTSKQWTDDARLKIIEFVVREALEIKRLMI
jgi:hypothetical protein